jgi:dolichyl-phosphate-mannose-protein mannosyltransferase
MPTRPFERWSEVPLLLGVIGSTFIGRSFTAVTHGGADSQLFAYIGLRWLHGAKLYLDVWDNRPPGIFAIDASVFSVFPKNFIALAVAEGVFVLGCIGTVYLLMRRLDSPRLVNYAATASLAITSNQLFYNQGGNLTEVYLLWPATLSMYFFVRSSLRFRGKWVFLAGFFSGLAALLKPVGLAPLMAQVTWLAFVALPCRRVSFRQLAISIYLNFAGALVAWIPFGIYFWMGHALREFLNASLGYNFEWILPSSIITGKREILEKPLLLALRLRPVSGLLVCTIIGVGLYIARNHRLAQVQTPKDQNKPILYFWGPLFFLWLLFDIGGAELGPAAYPHYFLQLMPSLSVAASLSYWLLLDRARSELHHRVLNTAILAVFVGPLAFLLGHDAYRSLGLLFRLRSPQSWCGLANQLNLFRKPGDTLFVWPYVPGIYLATEMESTVPQLFGFRIYLSEDKRFRDRHGKDILAQLESAEPTFIVDEEGANQCLEPDPVHSEFHIFVARRYAFVCRSEKLSLYRKKDEVR